MTLSEKDVYNDMALTGWGGEDAATARLDLHLNRPVEIDEIKRMLAEL